MHGYQIKALVQRMYLIHELIREKKWDELKRNVQLDCAIEDILIEINDYPGELSVCTIEDFFDTIVLVDFDGWNVDVVAQFWVDGEESDLSMEFSAKFCGRKIKSIILKQVHVF